MFERGINAVLEYMFLENTHDKKSHLVIQTRDLSDMKAPIYYNIIRTSLLTPLTIISRAHISESSSKKQSYIGHHMG